ncbi:MAG: efflux RND transporter permease subunit [Eubacterium sp.]|nr:efflux RND transporter permease subunit [Eubacterium sp.]
MEKFSVKKPFTILVLVIMIITLGVVSVTRLSTDLLPEMNLPYLMVITAYPGASPEKVENTVGVPMERALGTISGVKNITTANAENYCMTQLEFEDGTNMDSALVKVSGAVDEVSAALPDDVSTPNIMEISMDMMATMYVAVSRDGYDVYDLTDYVRDEVVPYMERQEGVARVTTIGSVEKSIQVELNQDKIDKINDRILGKTNDALADARKQLDDAEKKVREGQDALEKQEASFGSTVASSIFDQISGQVPGISSTLRTQLESLGGTLTLLQNAVEDLEPQKDDAVNTAKDTVSDLNDAVEEASAYVQLVQSAMELAAQQAELAQQPVEDAAEGLSGAADQAGKALDQLEDITESADQALSQLGDLAESAAQAGSQAGAGGQQDAGSGQAAGTDGGDDQQAADTSSSSDAAQETSDASGTADDSAGSAGQTDSSADSTGQAGDSSGQQAGLPSGAAQQAAQLQQLQQIQQQIAQLPPEIQQAISDPAALQQLYQQAQQNLLQAQEAVTGAQKELSSAQQNYNAAYTKEQIDQLKKSIQSALTSVSNAGNATAENFSELMKQVSAITTALARVDSTLDVIEAIDISQALSDRISGVREGLKAVDSGLDSVPGLLGNLESAYGSLTQAQLDAAVGFATATMQLSTAQAQLRAAREQYESSRDAALKNANLDQLLTAETLSQLIYAQNFAMPAGYIDDENDNSWLLKVGEQFEDTKEINDALLVDLDSVGVIRLYDVADITVIDNADDSYAKLNGQNAICLCIYKASTAGTNEVSKTSKRALDDLAERSEGLQVVSLMDQGIYIDLIVESILSSILLGALLAVIVLILFLKDIRPTLVVGISIPLSVLFTIVLMYFSGLSLNMMTLSGLALGIGMLVDNSIVVMENIFRLRGLGISGPRAAVQGARQVRGAIIASTLTTVCVFLPMVFTSGTVRELLIPMALSIGYCLMASLVVALTVVPASASTILRNAKPKRQPIMDHVSRGYGRLLSWCLRFKIVPLALSVALLILTVWRVVQTGIVLLPEMASSDIEVDITTDASMDRQTSYRKVDEVIDRLLEIDGVNYIGAIDMSSSAGLISSMAVSSDEYGSYMSYVIADDQADPDRLAEIIAALKKAGEDIEGCNVTVSAGDMSDMTTLSGSDDLTLNIYGADLDKLTEISSEVQDLVSEVPGFENIKDSTENGEKTLQLAIDRDKAMEYGFTTAQIYAAIAARMTTSVKSTTITADGIDLVVNIIDETDPLMRENLLDLELEETDLTAAAATGAAGATGSAGTGDMSGAGGMTGSAGMTGTAGGDLSGIDSLSSLFGDEEDPDNGSDENSEDNGDDDSDENKNSDSDSDKKIHTLGEFATVTETTSLARINRENQSRYLTVTADAADGQNATLLTRQLSEKLSAYRKGLDHGYRVEIAGQNETISNMITQMAKLLLLGVLFIYLVMVAQFQSLLSPFIVLFTVPLAFTGGMLGLMIARQPLSMLALMGFLILVGTVVNNGIVFVDYANQLRMGGMKRRDALVATGQTRMRPIIMTALTTILAMARMMFGNDMGSQLGSGMAIVITGGLLYATLMTLFIIPVLYDIFFKRNPLNVDTGDDLDEEPDDAAHFLGQMKEKKES